jgi:hypothetical protein
MLRALTILGVLALVGVGYYLFVWSAVSPEARTARPYAKRLIAELKEDPRFTNVTVSVSNLGSKGPLMLWGTVASDSDLEELRRRVDALGCPAGKGWNVRVRTNRLNSVP